VAPEVRLLLVASIKTDGGAQYRIAPDPDTVKEYADLMRAGVEFPPISVRYDGTDSWPSDGFHRSAAAKLAEISEIRAEVRPGAKEDAKWDSCAANASDGLRRTQAETEAVIRKALGHPNAAKLSNSQMAKHLGIPLTTLHRHREKLILSSGQDSSTRMVTVTRGGQLSKINVSHIGQRNKARRMTPRREMQEEIAQLRDKAPDRTKDLLRVIEKWARGQVLPARFLDLIEDILQREDTQTATNGGAPQPSVRGCALTRRQQHRSFRAGDFFSPGPARRCQLNQC
jgi:hypothetical protein